MSSASAAAAADLSTCCTSTSAWWPLGSRNTAVGGASFGGAYRDTQVLAPLRAENHPAYVVRIEPGAEIEEDNGTTIYELEGEADGRTWEIEIDGTGEILEVEEE